MSELVNNVALAFKTCNEQRERIEDLERLLAESREEAKQNALMVIRQGEKLSRLRQEHLEPAEQCENCDQYYAAAAVQRTEDDVRLCPECYKACVEGGADD